MTAARCVWTAPANGGAAITDYVLERRRSGGAWTRVNPAGTGLSYVDTSAASGDEYRVAAVNSAGQGAWSNAGTYGLPAGFLTADSAFMPFGYVPELSTSSAAALRAKGIADDVKNGVITASSLVANVKDVNNRAGGIALTTALWWKRTGDATYLAPLKTFIQGLPRVPDGAQVLNELRAFGGIFMAVDILKQSGEWSDSLTLPNHNNITWATFLNGDGGTLLPFHTRVLGTGNGRWQTLDHTANDTATNWGGMARNTYLGLALVLRSQSMLDLVVALTKKWLGDQTTGKPDFNSASDYIASWDNWSANTNGANKPLKAGVGKTDAAQPGLDGVIVDDINRGVTGYDPAVAFYGATGGGITYPLEQMDGLYPTLTCLRHMGYPIETWGEGGNAVQRMNARFALIRPGDTQSLFTNTESQFAIYRNYRHWANRLDNATYNSATALPATTSGTGSLLRASSYADWLTSSPSWSAP